MKINFSELFRISGTADRSTYAVVGFLGFALKHNLDRLIATLIFHRPWNLFNYWIPVRDVARITQLGGADAPFLATMVAFALPFIWIGTMLTMKRLRSAGLPPQLVALFFIPFLNLVFFLVLCLVPERELAVGELNYQRRSPSFLARAVPESQFGSAAISLLIIVPVGFASAIFGARVLPMYGLGMFVALPFTMGLAAALIYGIRQPRTMKACIGVACLAVTILGFLLLALAVEGLFCLIMALPLALPLAAFGGISAYVIQKRRWIQRDAPIFLSLLLVFAPGVEWVEHVAALPASIYMVRTSIEIEAPPEHVWKQVVAFTEIPPPTEWMFRAGIAYPIRAEMRGTGAGAERLCVFSTGSFVEPIEIWDAPRRLKFSVSSNPAPMEEWTPYSHIEPLHLHGFLVSEGGQFLLTRLPSGGTRLEGTTWYKHGLWPATYWRVWSDAIIHRIHLRVLRHIRDEVAIDAASVSR